jgi:hypothetical protein
MEFQEYPLCLYKGGDPLSQDSIVVLDADEREVARAEGYMAIGEKPAETKPQSKQK